MQSMFDRGMRVFLFAVIALAFSFVAAPAWAQGPPVYDVEHIGPGVNGLDLIDLNDRGEVVGGVFGPVPGGFGYTAIFWSDGCFVYMGANWGDASAAVSINNSGVILGHVVGYGDDLDRLFEIDAEGNISYPEPFDAAVDVRAKFINDSGQIVGTYQLTPTVASIPFFWDRTTTPYDLVPQWADLVFLGGLNNLGQVAGASREGVCGNSGFLWEENFFIDFERCGKILDRECGRDTSQIVGCMYFEGGNRKHAFLFEDSEFTDLGVLNGEAASVANGINNRGWIVGDSSSDDPPSRRAFIAIDGVMYDLNDFVSTDAWRMTRALKINDRGQILMEANPVSGFGAAFLLLTPPVSFAIENLIELVGSLELQHGIENGLVVKLEHAIEASTAGDLEGACSLIQAFINQVNAQTGKKIGEEQAMELLEAAEQIKAQLACP